ncbi:MAG: hypothetical protein CVV27_20335 [Candidatus Melainabacteria bacterium HGW-Melainabacteria-1]|nr:MAG: hypothetical protein CVV27_20335 [Candidatus Melainabacteria bacterium HGW-Melainabacteria-1]
MNQDPVEPLTPATREAYLEAVTIGGRKPLNGTIYLAPYDPDWPAAYARHARRILDALGDKALLLEHAGSTSVPDLPAKPIIDIVLAVADTDDEDAYVPQLTQQGFALRIREPEWFEHRLFKPADESANLHVFPVGCPEITRMLAFRDWLRSHPADRLLYAQSKRSLAAQTWRYTQDYADAKSEVVQAIMARALPSASTEP